MITPQQSLTENFYLWEKRGRGWTVWDAPVELEPGFAAFVHSYSGAQSPIVDDGRKLTRVGSWLQKLRGGQRKETGDTKYCYEEQAEIQRDVVIADAIESSGTISERNHEPIHPCTAGSHWRGMENVLHIRRDEEGAEQ